LYNYIVPLKDEVNNKIYINEDGMDVVVFSRRRVARV
jgi:hypothetical protein